MGDRIISRQYNSENRARTSMSRAGFDPTFPYSSGPRLGGFRDWQL